MSKKDKLKSVQRRAQKENRDLEQMRRRCTLTSWDPEAGPIDSWRRATGDDGISELSVCFSSLRNTSPSDAVNPRRRVLVLKGRAARRWCERPPQNPKMLVERRSVGYGMKWAMDQAALVYEPMYLYWCATTWGARLHLQIPKLWYLAHKTKLSFWTIRFSLFPSKKQKSDFLSWGC